jgi:hypothetical protein
MSRNRHVCSFRCSRVSVVFIRRNLTRFALDTRFNFLGSPEVMREYRKVDDGIGMRMNRNSAFFRDRTREGRSVSGSEEESCAYFWKELVGA